MTREEERIKETIKAADEYIHKRIYEDDCGRTGDTFPAFIEGAEWADQHPRKGLWDSQKVLDWVKKTFSETDKRFNENYSDLLIKCLCKAMEE